MKLAFLVLTGVIWAQAPVVPPSQAMCNRALQLMDAGGVAVPGLVLVPPCETYASDCCNVAGMGANVWVTLTWTMFGIAASVR